MSNPIAWWDAGEKAILACMLQQPRCIREVQLIVEVEDFWSPAHRIMFELLIECYDDGIENVDPLIISQNLIAAGKMRAVGTMLLPDLIAALVVPVNVGQYALRVRELSRVRRFKEMFIRGVQAVSEVETGIWRREADQPDLDLDRLQDTVAKILLEGEILVDEKLSDGEISGLSTWMEFLQVQDSPQDWLVRDLIERMDVWMILAGEGGGKSWLSRQCVLCMSAGIHPFRWEERIRPVRSLLIDLENAESMVRRQSRGVYHQALAHGEPEKLNEHGWIWREPAGLDLRKRHDQLRFQQVIERTRPEFVAMGSLYNSFVKGRDDWETAAEDVKQFLNRMRSRYGFALLLEHHMPKGDGDDRPLTPYGSSVWMRWITHGYVMNRLGENLWKFTPFRGARDARTIPAGLQRGGMFPWSPIWDNADIDAMLELEPPAPRRRRA